MKINKANAKQNQNVERHESGLIIKKPPMIGPNNGPKKIPKKNLPKAAPLCSMA